LFTNHNVAELVEYEREKVNENETEETSGSYGIVHIFIIQR